MTELEATNRNISIRRKGFSLPELLIVLLIVAVILVLALPQIISSTRAFRFAGLQRQIAASLRDARQEAMSQRTQIIFRYQHDTRQIIIYGGRYGTLGNGKNIVNEMSDARLSKNDIKYGRPPGVSNAALSDGTSLTGLQNNAVEITFQPDGSVINTSNVPQNNALYFYLNQQRKETAFAVSVLGAGGRVKVWRYSAGANMYVE